MGIYNWRQLEAHWSVRRRRQRRCVNDVRIEQIGCQFNNGISGEWVNFLLGHSHEESYWRLNGDRGGDVDETLELYQKRNHVLGHTQDGSRSTAAESVQVVVVVDDHRGIVLVVVRIGHVIKNPTTWNCSGPRHISEKSVRTSVNSMSPVISGICAVVIVNSVAVDCDQSVKSLGDQRGINADGEGVAVERGSDIDWREISGGITDIVEDTVESRINSGLAVSSTKS